VVLAQHPLASWTLLDVDEAHLPIADDTTQNAVSTSGCTADVALEKIGGAERAAAGGAVGQTCGADWFPASRTDLEGAENAIIAPTLRARYPAIRTDQVVLLAPGEALPAVRRAAVLTNRGVRGRDAGERQARRHAEVHRIQRQEMLVLVRPTRGLAVQRALGIVALKGDYLPDPNDQVGERLSGCPVVADTDGVRGDVGVEDRRQHPALRCLARVAAGEEHLHKMLVLFHNLAIRARFEAAKAILDVVLLWRTTQDALDVDAGVASKRSLDHLVIGLEPPESDVHG